jgi:hypothetical protein
MIKQLLVLIIGGDAPCNGVYSYCLMRCGSVVSVASSPVRFLK